MQQKQQPHAMNTLHTVAALQCLLDDASTLALLVLMHHKHPHQPHLKAVKRRKDGRLRKARIGNRDRHRSLSNRQKLQQLPDAVFGGTLRMERPKFEQLLAKVEPVLHAQRPRKRKLPLKYKLYDRLVDPYIALAFTLCWLGGARQWDVMYMFDVAKTTWHVWTWRCIKAIIHVLKDNIRFPTSTAALDSLAAGFANIASGLGAAIPHTVCAFDGVVIQKCPPPQAKVKPGGTVTSNTSAHYYRKGYFGAACMAFVDAKCRFLSISMACAASCHDSTMFECSHAGQLLLNGLADPKYNAVGDDAFVTRGHIITPYSGNSPTPQEDAFNYYLSLQRQVVERAFGIWKRKWGIFWRTLCVSEPHVKLIIAVTCHLHNFCIDRNVSPNIDDYIVHDDAFWQQVKPVHIRHPRVRQPVVPTEPVLLDDAERAAMLPSDFTQDAQQTAKRKSIKDAIAAQGLLRPAAVPVAVQYARSSACLPMRAATRKRGIEEA